MKQVIGIIRGYFQLVYTIIRTPTQFFRSLSEAEGKTKPLVFAMITNWIGSAFYFIFSSSTQEREEIKSWLNQQFQQWTPSEEKFQYETWLPSETVESVDAWTQSMSSVILSPFTTLLSVFLAALVVYFASKLFTTRRTGMTQAIQLTAYSQASQIFLVVPWIGPVLAGITRFILLILGAKELYQVSALRGALIAFFPYIISLGMMVVFVFFAIALALVFGAIIAGLSIV